MPIARPLSFADLREIIGDAEELLKGAQVFDAGGLAHLARVEDRLFAEAQGVMAAPYRVSVSLGEGTAVRVRCTCPAAYSRPICKHGAALLIAWAQAPESFAVASAPPPGAESPGVKKRAVKRGKASFEGLVAEGAAQVVTLVRELAATGVAAQASGRSGQVDQLGENLREHKLRRLAGRTHDLAALLRTAEENPGALDPIAYTDLVADLLLTARRLERHVQGEPLEPRHVEALLGKTWKKSDRTPIADLELVEYGYTSRTTSDGFVIRESRFVDAGSGEHFSEKQILPGFLVKRTPPKRSWYGRVLRGAAGSLYPGFAPRRLDLERPGQEAPLDHDALAQIAARAQPDVGALVAVFQALRRDVFAPDLLPATLRADTLFADGPRLKVVDAAGGALFLPDDEALEVRLGGVLAGARLAALIGDVGLDAGLPAFFPAALLVERHGALELAPVMAAPPDLGAAGAKRQKIAARALDLGPARAPAQDAARAAGASPASVALLEIRDALAAAFVRGLGTLTPRAVEPLVARLTDLGLGKHAELLSTLVARAEPGERLEDFVKIHRVIEVALVRLLAAAQVDRASVVRVPGYESVVAPRVETPRSPAAVRADRMAGTLGRYAAALHLAEHHDRLPLEALADPTATEWADGSASPHIARALARHPAAAVEAALAVLDGALDCGRAPATVRMTRLTATRVLAAVARGAGPSGPDRSRVAGADVEGTADGPADPARTAGAPDLAADRPLTTTREAVHEPARAALRVLGRLGAEDRDPAVRAIALEVIAGHDRDRRRQLERRIARLSEALLSAARKEERIAAATELAALGELDAAPALRLSLTSDVAADVRAAAGLALAGLGDASMLETFVRLLEGRLEAPALGELAARALGVLGDARAIAELRAAREAGWRPQIVARALRALDPTAAGSPPKKTRTRSRK